MNVGQAGRALLLIGALALLVELGWLGVRLLGFGRRLGRLRAVLAVQAAALDYELARGRLLRLQLALALAGLSRQTRLGRLAYLYYRWGRRFQRRAG